MRTNSIKAGTFTPYRPSATVMVILFTEQSLSWISFDVDFDSALRKKNAGLFGVGKDMVSLRSMEIISEVVGLSIASSCTQRRAT